MFTVVQGFFNLECKGSRGKELLCCEDMIESIVIKTTDGNEVELGCMDAIFIKVAETAYGDVDNEKDFKDDLNLIYDECDKVVDCHIIKLDDVLYSTIIIDDNIAMRNEETGESKISKLREIELMLSDEAAVVKLYRLRRL